MSCGVINCMKNYTKDWIMAASKKKESTKIIEWLGTGLGAVFTALSLFGMGFVDGACVEDMRSDLENYKKQASHNQEFLDYKIEKEKEIFELRSTINKLQSDLFNEQNKQTHEKK